MHYSYVCIILSYKNLQIFIQYNIAKQMQTYYHIEQPHYHEPFPVVHTL